MSELDRLDFAPFSCPEGSFAEPSTNTSSKPDSPLLGPNWSEGNRRKPVSEPLTWEGSTAADRKINEELKEELQRNHPMETDEGMKHRTFVLGELQRLAEEWVADEAEKKGIQFTRPGVKLLTFGSYWLGAVNPGSDIDTVLLGPKFVHREQFFAGMVPKLRNHKAVSSILPVPDAYTPVATLKFYDVEIDLLYSQLDSESVSPNLDLSSDDIILRGLDEQSLRSLNGCRVAESIHELVPKTDVYTETLMFIKCWAKRRGIYGNKLGYFGGITWALCLARVCQLFPNYCMSMVVIKFFRILDQWNWSKPILLCAIDEYPSSSQLSHFKVWNPKGNSTDRNHLMPVITPAFPSMNSTHNVMESTKRIICDEIDRGYRICKDIENNKASFSDLYAPRKFFSEYRNYLWIEIEADEEDPFRRYAGWVESKVRILVGYLEQVPGLRAHPYSRNCSWLTVDDESKIPPEERDRFLSSWFIGLSFSHESGAFVGQTVDMRPAINPFIDVLQDWRDLATTDVKLRLKNVEARNLPPFVHVQEDPLRASSKLKCLRVDKRPRSDPTRTDCKRLRSERDDKSGT